MPLKFPENVLPSRATRKSRGRSGGRRGTGCLRRSLYLRGNLEKGNGKLGLAGKKTGRLEKSRAPFEVN